MINVSQLQTHKVDSLLPRKRRLRTGGFHTNHTDMIYQYVCLCQDLKIAALVTMTTGKLLSNQQTALCVHCTCSLCRSQITRNLIVEYVYLSFFHLASPHSQLEQWKMI